MGLMGMGLAELGQRAVGKAMFRQRGTTRPDSLPRADTAAIAVVNGSD
jgi:hypothetical protein